MNYITKKNTLPEEKFTIVEIMTVFSEIFFKKNKVEVYLSSYVNIDEWGKPSTRKEDKQMANRNTRQTSKKVASKASKILLMVVMEKMQSP